MYIVTTRKILRLVPPSICEKRALEAWEVGWDGWNFDFYRVAITVLL